MAVACWTLVAIVLVAGYTTALMDCGENSIKDLECALLFVDYYKLKGEYDDAEKRKDLDPNAYSDLHQRLDKAGVKVGKRVAAASYESKTPEVVPKREAHPKAMAQNRLTYQGQYNSQCGPDGLYYSDAYTYVVCSNGHGYVQRCPYGTRNQDQASYARGATYHAEVFCGTNLVNQRGASYGQFFYPGGQYAAGYSGY